uniref:Uncharacterized protein n=1 Tax=Cannabis sativa TaxID=3483 RepID=A0A803PWV3_CANSA
MFNWLDGAALRIIESVMVSKDVRSSSVAIRSSLRDFIRFESISIMRENAEKPVEKKLLDLDFLVRAFALLGDVEAELFGFEVRGLAFEGFQVHKLPVA